MKEEGLTTSRRPYRMRARAEAAEETRRRIMHAAIALYAERWLDQIALEEVAARAGVTVQTVLRRFGNKEGLIAAAGDELRRHVEEQRATAPVGDVAGVIRTLFDHYEEVGEIVLRSLAQEGMSAAIRTLTDQGRASHHAWVRRTFAPFIADAPAADRGRIHAQFAALTDVYVWKLLRRDLGLDRTQAEWAVQEMIEALRGAHERADSAAQERTAGHGHD